VVSSRDIIDVVDLPSVIRDAPPVRHPARIAKPGMTMSQIEKEAITQALDMTDGNRIEASKILGISVRTLQRKINRYGLG
jgi:transcriptional regulator with PAS, ATPase and Fis domain